MDKLQKYQAIFFGKRQTLSAKSTGIWILILILLYASFDRNQMGHGQEVSGSQTTPVSPIRPECEI